MDDYFGLFIIRDKPLEPRPTRVEFIPPNHATIEAFRKAWKALHTRRRLTADWLTSWAKGLPPGCGCKDGYDSYCSTNPPVYGEGLPSFRWGWGLHEFVNKKRNVTGLSFVDALKLWRPDLMPQLSRVQRQATIVTSLYAKNIDRQLECIRTWFRSGFDVVSVNLESEISSLKKIFPVRFVVSSGTNLYDRPVPKVYDMLTTKVDTQLRLVLNADIEILQPIDDFLTKAPALGLRRNYHDTPMDGDLERWGIDAFLLDNDMCKTFPDLPFGIGQPMWDYWVPWHLQRQGLTLSWCDEPLFFHKIHEIQWRMAALQTGWDIIYDHYGDGEDWELWRLNQPHHDAAQRVRILEHRYANNIENATVPTKERETHLNAPAIDTI